MTGHWSDCAIYNAPALPTGPCDCGGLELALDSVHDLIPALVSGSRGEGLLLCNESPGRFVQPQQLPSDGFVADAAAGNLPNPHNLMPLFGDANGMDLNITGIAVVLKMKNAP